MSELISWISVDEKKPELKNGKSEVILVTDGEIIATSRVHFDVLKWKDLFYLCPECSPTMNYITHWMPLPKLPHS